MFSGKLLPFADSLRLYAPGVNTGILVWISIPNDYVQLYLNVENSLTIAGTTLSITTNAVTTSMIAYKLWYVAVN